MRPDRRRRRADLPIGRPDDAPVPFDVASDPDAPELAALERSWRRPATRHADIAGRPMTTGPAGVRDRAAVAAARRLRDRHGRWGGGRAGPGGQLARRGVALGRAVGGGSIGPRPARPTLGRPRGRRGRGCRRPRVRLRTVLPGHARGAGDRGGRGDARPRGGDHGAPAGHGPPDGRRDPGRARRTGDARPRRRSRPPGRRRRPPDRRPRRVRTAARADLRYGRITASRRRRAAPTRSRPAACAGRRSGPPSSSTARRRAALAIGSRCSGSSTP